MKFFLDTANIDDIKRLVSWGVVDGVTTNPSLIAKEGVSLEERIKAIAAVVDGPISSEVVSTDAEGMMEEARRYVQWHPNIHVKLPMTAEGLKALKMCTAEGIKTNVTLIFSPGQALLAAKNGATFVSPFVGRLDDISEDGMGLIEDIMDIFDNYGFATEVLVASVRHPRHVIEAAQIGAHVATVPPKIIEQLVKHPLTDNGLAKFLADWETVKDKQ